MLYKLFLLFCLYLPFQIALNPAEGIDLASVRVIIPILALIWLILALKNRQVFIPAKIQTALTLSFLFLAGLSLFWAENTDWGARKFLFLLSIFPIYFVVNGISSNVIPREVEEFKKTVLDPSTSPSTSSGSAQDDNFNVIKIVKFLVWGAGLAAMIGIIQFLLQFVIGLDATASLWRNYVTPLFLGSSFSQAVAEYPSWAVNIAGRDYLRAFGTFPDPHMFSFYLGLTLPLAIGLYFSLRRGSTSLDQGGQKRSNLDGSKIYLVLAIIILLANLLTFSRGGYAGLFAGLIFIAIYFAINKKISARKIFVSFVLIFVIFVSLALTPIGKRFITSFSPEEGSNKGRFENWSQAAEMIKNNPLGVGIGNYSYEIEPSADYRKPIYAHNLYLDIAAETGIINSLIFILLLMFSIRSFIIKVKNNILCLGGAASLIIFSSHSFFDTALYSVQALPLLLIIMALSAKK